MKIRASEELTNPRVPEQPKDILFLEILGIKAGAHGRFAIVAVLLALMVSGAAYLVGHSLGFW